MPKRNLQNQTKPEAHPRFAEFRERLLTWYRAHRRDLPWRRLRDPYAIWVSEIMLQQTQVKTVIPYYEKFLHAFPTLRSLAEASEEQVLAHWSGLGYYRRAKLLHRGAQQVLRDFSGELPRSIEGLQSIPSIGRYTAGAIASIAFEIPAALVDGNVVRVLSRIFAEQGHAKSPALQKKIWQHAEGLIDPENPGDFNQGLMELGATLCGTHFAHCSRCPVQSLCAARAEGDVTRFPETPPAAKTVSLHRKVALCRNGDALLLVKRRESRWFQGLWELPQIFWNPEVDEENSLEFLRQGFGFNLTKPEKLPVTRHTITHHRIVTNAWVGEAPKPKRLSADYESWTWMPLGELERFAISNFDRKVIRLLGQENRQLPLL